MRRYSGGKGFELFDLAVYVVCGALALFALYPMWFVFIMSISEPSETLRGNFYWWPKGFYLGNYIVILQDGDMWKSAWNSVIYVVSGTFLMLITSVLVAYPLIRPTLMFRKALVIYLLIPMYFGGGLIPYFLLIQKLGIYNTPWALILPGYGIWNIILMRTYFKSLPNDLAESAFIDGANNFTVLLRIYMPLSKPALAVVAIYTIVGIWNSWFGAMVYVPNKNWQPLQMYLKRVLIESSVNLAAMGNSTTGFLDPETAAALSKKAMNARQLKYTMIMVCSIPVIAVYPMFQKHFVKGVMLGSLKG